VLRFGAADTAAPAAEAYPFDNLQRNAVLYDAKCFNDAQINARKCSRVITQVAALRNPAPVAPTRADATVPLVVADLVSPRPW